jgi:alanine racemase
VAAGYADSYPRALSNKGAYAVIGGQKCPQIGRICMDMCMFDVTGAAVSQGDEVILYGQGGMSLDQVAALTGSINCEMTCLLTRRVHKLYL